MTKNLKLLLAGVGAIAVLSGATVALVLTGDEPAESDSSSSSTVETATLIDAELADITSVTITRPDSDPFKVVALGDDVFTIENDGDLPFDSSLAYTIPNNLSKLSGTLVRDSADDYSEFGFSDDNVISLSVELADGSSSVIHIGDDTPLNSGVYVRVDDKPEIYAVDGSLLSNARQPETYFITLSVVEEPAEEDYPRIDKVTVSRDDIDYDIVFEYDPIADTDLTYGNSACHNLTEPIFSYLNVTNSTAYTHGIFGLSASKVLELQPTAETLSQYGFDDPFCTVVTETEDGDYTLTLGKKVEVNGVSYYAGVLEGIDVVYAFSTTDAPWLTLKPADVTSSLIFGTYIYDIGVLDITSTSGNYRFEGSGGDSDNYVCTMNGKECTTDYFKLFYQFLLKTPAEEVCFDEPTGEPVCTIVLERQDEYDGETIAFYDCGNRQYIIVHNGEPSFKCRSTFVDRLLSNIAQLESYGEIINTY